MEPAAPLSRPAEPRRRWRALELLLLLELAMALGAALAGLALVNAWSPALGLELGRAYALLVLALGLSAFLALLAIVVAVRAPERRATGILVRSGLVLAITVAALHVALYPTLREPWLAAQAGLAGGLFALLVLAGPRCSPEARWPRSLERVVFGLVLTLPLAELALRGVNALFAPPLLADPTSSLQWLETLRLRPGEVRFGSPVNSRGDYDAEPPARGAGPLVVVVGDSFSVSSVALPLHYTSVAERELGIECYNMGAVGIDPAQYLELVRREALALQPTVLVIGLFIGNDLEFDQPTLVQPGLLVALVDRRGSLLARFLGRATKLLAERWRTQSERVGAVQGEDVPPVAPEELARSFPWMADPMLEEPTFSEPVFRELERERALQVTRADRPADYSCFPWMKAIVEAAGSVPVLFLLIPDEFQVEDQVWADVLADVPAAERAQLERERPQRELAEFCRAEGLLCHDLLPALRAVPPLADGRRHLYHLRDTHFNARGNEVAGLELARALRGLLETR